MHRQARRVGIAPGNEGELLWGYCPRNAGSALLPLVVNAIEPKDLLYSNGVHQRKEKRRAGPRVLGSRERSVVHTAVEKVQPASATRSPFPAHVPPHPPVMVVVCVHSGKLLAFVEDADLARGPPTQSWDYIAGKERCLSQLNGRKISVRVRHQLQVEANAPGTSFGVSVDLVGSISLPN